MNRPAAAFLVVPLMTASVLAQGPLRVACVGDSITYGDKIDDRAAQSYPAVLERLSRGRFAVGNFGVNGTTALQGTGRAWVDTEACRDALAFAPDAVVLMLGINDLGFPERSDRYPVHLRRIVERFRALSPPPRVLLCTLTPLAPAEAHEPANRTIRETMNPAIRAVAAETGAAVVDVSSAFPNRPDLLPDGLHPSPEGAEIIARAVLAALDPPASAPPAIQPAPVAGPVDVSIRHEAEAARQRAERWLRGREPLEAAPAPEPAADAASLLPLLAGDDEDARFADVASLAETLVRAGEETVFLPDGRPVAWREALLHQLVLRQRIDPQGGGFWSDAGGDDRRATAFALRALAAALGE